ncbi:MAG: HNH endonuclease [Anaerolineae bacterium]
MPISSALRHLIAERDKNRCAYCRTTEENCGLRMHVDHIIPESAGGPTTPDNLCLACFSCNVYEGGQQTGIDPSTGEPVPLFHPLRQRWHDHFAWDESKTQIIGLTPCGRATVVALKVNNPTVLRARRRWVSAGWHPPEE